MKRINVSLLATLAGVMMFAACSGEKKSETAAGEETVENVRVMKLQSKTLNRTLEYSANALAQEEINLVPVSPGRIEKIMVEVGSRVRAGQELVKMDATSLMQAKIQIATLEQDFQRYEVLKETGAISQQAYDQALAQLNIQKTNLKYLEENTTIKAPFTGVVSAKNYENGEMYSGALPIITVLQLNPLKAYIHIPESYYPQVQKGMKVEVTSDTYPGETFSASVYNVAPTVNPSTRTFEVELRISNSGERLKPGMFIRAKLAMGEATAIMAPYQAVLKLQGSVERYMFVNNKGVAKRVRVSLGQRFDDQIEIIADGIGEGDEIVISGQARLKDGAKLNVVK
ncbi:MAG TPA: efflux RND transporter periplasmic adaptor subunit [Bacteroidales bacterium]|nr:efflux RND transporter periplasmic adaptor subunit [Bacteroidales bacterium]